MACLSATFVRHAGERDRIHVRRSDGSEVSWVFPSYGDGLPHDLVHLVVEAAFGLTDGFWGKVDAGADPKRVNDEANRVGGRDKYAAFGADRSGLLLAEALPNAPWLREAALEELRDPLLAAAGDTAIDLSPERLLRVRAGLERLSARWRGLLPKGALTLVFDPAHAKVSFDEVDLV